MAVGHSDGVDLASAMGAVFAECEAGLARAAPTAGLLMNAWGIDHQVVIDAVRARYQASYRTLSLSRVIAS